MLYTPGCAVLVVVAGALGASISPLIGVHSRFSCAKRVYLQPTWIRATTAMLSPPPMMLVSAVLCIWPDYNSPSYGLLINCAHMFSVPADATFWCDAIPTVVILRSGPSDFNNGSTTGNAKGRTCTLRVACHSPLHSCSGHPCLLVDLSPSNHHIPIQVTTRSNRRWPKRTYADFCKDHSAPCTHKYNSSDLCCP